LFLRTWMLWSPMRQYVIEKIKTPLMKSIVAFGKGGSWLGMLIALIQIIRTAKKYPVPSEEIVQHPNTLILLDIQEKFFRYEDNPGRNALFRAIWRIFIDEYEHDPYYRYRIDWVLEEVSKTDWLPREMREVQCWNGPTDGQDGDTPLALRRRQLSQILRTMSGPRVTGNNVILTSTELMTMLRLCMSTIDEERVYAGL